jgi:hypothetical protein
MRISTAILAAAVTTSGQFLPTNTTNPSPSDPRSDCETSCTPIPKVKHTGIIPGVDIPNRFIMANLKGIITKIPFPKDYDPSKSYVFEFNHPTEGRILASLPSKSLHSSEAMGTAKSANWVALQSGYPEEGIVVVLGGYDEKTRTFNYQTKINIQEKSRSVSAVNSDGSTYTFTDYSQCDGRRSSILLARNGLCAIVANPFNMSDGIIGRIVTSTRTPTTTSRTTKTHTPKDESPTQEQSSENGPSAGLVAGITVGSAIGLLCCAVCICREKIANKIKDCIGDISGDQPFQTPEPAPTTLGIPQQPVAPTRVGGSSSSGEPQQTPTSNTAAGVDPELVSQASFASSQTPTPDKKDEQAKAIAELLGIGSKKPQGEEVAQPQSVQLAKMKLGNRSK